MAPQVISIVPTPHYTMALMLAKSRPVLMSWQEYFRLLVSYIKDQPHSRASKQYLDESSMWRDAYRQSENAQLSLKARILELQRPDDETADELALSASKKRRRNPKQAREDFGLRRQALVNGLVDETGTGARVNEMAATTSLGDPILQGVYILQQTLTSNIPGPAELVNTSCHIAGSICLYLGEAHWATEPGTTTASPGSVGLAEPQGQIAFRAQGDEEIMGKLEAIGQIFPRLLAALDKLAQIPGGKDFEDQAVYAFIQILQVLLQRTCDIAAARVKEYVAKAVGPTGPSARSAENPCLYCKNRNLKCDSHIPKCRNCSRRKRRCHQGTSTSNSNTRMQTLANLPLSKQIIKLCELEITMLRFLNTAQQGHAKILKGFLCILFDMVGHNLQRAVFASDNGGLQQAANANGSSTDREHDMAVEAHAPYLIWILEQVQSSPSWHNISVESGQSTTQDNVHYVALQSRRKLQNTLLKSVFGQKASIDFEPSLRPAPEVPASDSMELHPPSGGIRGWFKHEVWRIVGWDVLRNQIKWD